MEKHPGMIPNLPADLKQIDFEAALQQMEVHYSTLKEVESTLRQLTIVLLAVYSGLQTLPMKDRSSSVSEIVEGLRSTVKFLTSAAKLLKV